MYVLRIRRTSRERAKPIPTDERNPSEDIRLLHEGIRVRYGESFRLYQCEVLGGIMWICCKCQKIYQDYPSNSVCECGNEDDFEEFEEVGDEL